MAGLVISAPATAYHPVSSPSSRGSGGDVADGGTPDASVHDTGPSGSLPPMRVRSAVVYFSPFRVDPAFQPIETALRSQLASYVLMSGPFFEAADEDIERKIEEARRTINGRSTNTGRWVQDQFSGISADTMIAGEVLGNGDECTITLSSSPIADRTTKILYVGKHNPCDRGKIGEALQRAAASFAQNFDEDARSAPAAATSQTAGDQGIAGGKQGQSPAEALPIPVYFVPFKAPVELERTAKLMSAKIAQQMLRSGFYTIAPNQEREQLFLEATAHTQRKIIDRSEWVQIGIRAGAKMMVEGDIYLNEGNYCDVIVRRVILDPLVSDIISWKIVDVHCDDASLLEAAAPTARRLARRPKIMDE